MTEREWQECEDPHAMLRFMAEKGAWRKFRLFTVACCRRVYHLLPRERQQWAEVAERHADGEASHEELEAASAHPQVRGWLAGGPWLPSDFTTASHPGWVSLHVSAETTGHASYAALEAVEAAGQDEDIDDDEVFDAAQNAEFREQAGLLRCLFGSPFRSASIGPAWLAWNDGAVIQLARHIYAERAFTDLPILADALEEAGCADADVLGHCRGSGPHTRGCWVVDLVLGKK
jgi:hypothetical protein